MNIIDHEVKKYDLWQEELTKKRKACILEPCKTRNVENFRMLFIPYYNQYFKFYF